MLTANIVPTDPPIPGVYTNGNTADPLLIIVIPELCAGIGIKDTPEGRLFALEAVADALREAFPTSPLYRTDVEPPCVHPEGSSEALTIIAQHSCRCHRMKRGQKCPACSAAEEMDKRVKEDPETFGTGGTDAITMQGAVWTNQTEN